MINDPNPITTPTSFEFAALSEAKNYRTALLHDFAWRLRGNVLEVGAGIGQITAELCKMPQIRKLASIEPDPGSCTQIRSQMSDLELIQGTIKDLRSDGSWNAVLSINVLEHIEEDEAELLDYQRLLAKENGALCLFVPARPEIYAPIDKDFGHFRRYTKPELQRKLRQAGFRIEMLRYYNSVGYLAWWLNFCLLKKRSFDIASVRLFDRAIFPVVHGFESRVCAPPIGQSLIAIAVADKLGAGDTTDPRTGTRSDSQAPSLSACSLERDRRFELRSPPNSQMPRTSLAPPQATSSLRGAFG